MRQDANETRKQIKNYTCIDVCKGMESALNFFEKKSQQREDKKGTRNIVVPAANRMKKLSKVFRYNSAFFMP